MDTIQLTSGTQTLVLHGAGTGGALRGAWLLPRCGPGEQVEDALDLVLEGAPGEIEATLEQVGRMAQAAPGRPPAYLEVRPAAGGALWRSPIVEAWPELRPAGAGQRARGRQGVTLHLLRQNWWEGPEAGLPLSNPHGSAVTAGLTVYNHEDAAHANYAHAAAAHIAGDLPAPARLEFTAATSETGTLWAGLNQLSDPANLAVTYPGEAAAPGSGVSAATLADPLYAAGGSYRRFTWSGTAPQAAAAWTLNALHLGRMGGRAFRGVLRFYTPPAESSLWACWRLAYPGAQVETLWEGPGQYLRTDAVLQDLPGLCLPPWTVPPGLNPPGLSLQLAVSAGAAGAHVLEIDDLTLLPLDGWRKYEPAAQQAAGLSVRDDTAQGHVFGLGAAFQTHAAEGPGFWLHPGLDARFTFLVGQRLSANIGLTAAVKVFYRPRRRGL